MYRKVTAIDMNNGEFLVKFGGKYAHFYDKYDPEHILEDIEAYYNGSDVSRWDNNDISSWEHCYEEASSCDILSLDELKEELAAYAEDDSEDDD